MVSHTSSAHLHTCCLQFRWLLLIPLICSQYYITYLAKSGHRLKFKKKHCYSTCSIVIVHLAELFVILIELIAHEKNLIVSSYQCKFAIIISGYSGYSWIASRKEITFPSLHIALDSICNTCSFTNRNNSIYNFKHWVRLLDKNYSFYAISHFCLFSSL